MTYEEFMRTISESSIEDWLYDDEKGSYVFMNDLSITMQRDRNGEFQDFYEPWVNNFSDKKATKQPIYLQYNGIVIKTFYTATVDGGRMDIPYPDLPSMKISYQDCNIGKIVNLNKDYNEYRKYLRLAGIDIE